MRFRLYNWRTGWMFGAHVDHNGLYLFIGTVSLCLERRGRR